MRLIFVNRFFYPDHSATSQMLADLAFGLAKKGIDVTVVTSRLRYDAPTAQLSPRETIGGVQIKRIRTSRFGRAGLLFRAIDYLTFHLAVAFELLRTVRPGDIVIAMTDPPAVSVVTAMITRLRRASLVNWLQDIFPEVAEALHVGVDATSVIATPLRILRNASLRGAEKNVVIGEIMAERLQRLGVAQERIIVIPNWADCEGIRPLAPEQNGLRADWKLEGQFVVAYSGNLGHAHDVETLLGAVAATARHPATAQEIHWVFIGGGAGYQRLQSEIKRLRSCGGRVSFHHYQPREALAESLSVADVHIVSLKPELEGLIVPSKFYGIAAAGRPTIFVGCRQGEIARLITRYDCGASVAIGDVLALVEIINGMASDAELCRAMGARARTMCEDNFSKTRAIAAWHELVDGIVTSKAIAAESKPELIATPQRGSRQEA